MPAKAILESILNIAYTCLTRPAAGGNEHLIYSDFIVILKGDIDSLLLEFCFFL